MPTRTPRALIESGTRALAAAGIGRAAAEARLLLRCAAGLTPEALLAGRDLGIDEDSASRFEAAIRRRADGEPISRIRGSREFWSLDFALSPDTLDPRPDSETVVDAVLAQVKARMLSPRRILDLGTGTGCLLLALLSELPQAFGIGTDLAEGAARTSRLNADRLGLSGRARFVVADWAAPLSGTFDIVVANPPYVATGSLTRLASEVRDHDPALALDGGPDGLDAYRRIVPQIGRILDRGSGILALEVGAGQAGPVAGLLESAGFCADIKARDLGGIERCIIATAAVETRESLKKGLDWGKGRTRFGVG